MGQALDAIKGRLSVSAVTCRVGQEGHEYKATINWDGRKIGTFQDDTRGGPPRIEISDAAVHKMLFDASKEQNVDEGYTLFADAKFVPNYVNGDLVSSVIYPLMQQADMEKRQLAQLKRWCKNKIVLTSDKPGEYVTINAVYDRAKHKAQLEARYPGREIINERFM